MTKVVLSKPALKPEQAPIPAPDGAASQSAPANATRPGDSRVLHTAVLGNLVVPGNVAGAPRMRLCSDEPRQMISSFSYTEMDELIALIQRERAGKLDEARSNLKASSKRKRP